MNNESVISKSQLDLLLENMRNSVSINKLLRVLKRANSLSTIEKNTIYHRILEVIKTSEPKSASMSILSLMEELLNEKIELVVQDLDGIGTEIEDKQSPIFRRVG